MPRPRAYLAALIACGLTLVACGDDPDTTTAAETGTTTAAATTFPTTIDNCGRSVTLDRRPEKVLTVGAAAVNVFHAAGAADHIVARSGEFGAPVAGPAGEAVADVETLTPGDPGAEAVIGTGADLVVGYGLFETTPEDLERAGIASLVLTNSCAESGGRSHAATLEDVYADVERIGELFGTQKHAARSVASMRVREQAAREQVADLPSRTAASIYFFGGTPSTNGNRNIIHSMMESLGLRNVFGDVDRDYIESNVEELIERDPDVLILSSGTGGPDETFADVKAQLLKIPGAKDMTAVREGRLISVTSDARDPGPGAVNGLEMLADQLASLR